MIAYPAIDPVAVRIGPVAIRWYGVAYLLGFLCGYGILRRVASRGWIALSREGVGELLSALVLGVVLGGRLGYVLFYNLPHLWEHPLHIVAVWEGGMSFHGGLAGVLVAAWIFGRKRSLQFLDLGDALALAAPPGLFFGRLANFINGELYGRVADLPWAMVFPGGGPLPRHPSQLYEALLEGFLLWLLVGWAWRRRRGRKNVALTVCFSMLGWGNPALGRRLPPWARGTHGFRFLFNANMMVCAAQDPERSGSWSFAEGVRSGASPSWRGFLPEDESGASSPATGIRVADHGASLQSC